MNQLARQLTRPQLASLAVLLGLCLTPFRHVFAGVHEPSMVESTASPAMVFSEDGFVYSDPLTRGWPSSGERLTSSLAGGDEAWNWQLLPEGLMYKSYIAGEKEARISNSFLHESGGRSLWDTTLGWRVGLVRFGTPREIQPEGFQLDVEGGTFLRGLSGDGNDVQSMDFRVGVPLTWREGPFQAKEALLDCDIADDTMAPPAVAVGHARREAKTARDRI